MRATRTAIGVVLSLLVLEGASGLGLFERGGAEAKPPATPQAVEAELRALDPATNQLVKQYRFRISLDAGFISFELDKHRDVLYALLKNGEQYTNPITTAELSAEAGNEIAAAMNVQGTPFSLKFVTAGDPSEPRYPRLVRAEYRSGHLSQALTDDQKARLGGQGRFMRTRWLSNAQDRRVSLWLGNRNGSWDLVEFDVVTEVFAAERELFDQVPGTYEQKAIALLGKALGNAPGFRESARELLPPGQPESLWSMYEGVPGAVQAAEGLRKALGGHFQYYRGQEVSRNGTTVSLPFLEFREGTFEGLYGGKRQIYITAYLKYLYEQGKPVLAGLIRGELEEKRVALEPGGYNWADYVPLTPAEGQELAKRALWYLGWAVEYTQFSGQNSVSLANSAYRVLESRVEPIRDWTHGEAAGRVAERNYLPESLHVGTVGGNAAEGGQGGVSRLHRLESGFVGSRMNLVATRPASGAALPIGRIDLLTSRNFAWEQGQIVEVVASAGEVSGPRSALNDRKLYTASTTQNLHLVREDNAEVTFGYRFPRHKVGGLMLINGLASQTPLSRAEYQKAQRWGLQYQDQQGNWQDYKIGSAVGPENARRFQTDATKYREFTYDYKGNVYQDNTALPGWTFASGTYYSGHVVANDGPAHASTVYIALPSGLDCYGIRVVDNTGNPTVTVAEMMVFESSPVDYLEEGARGGAEIPLSRIFVGGAAGIEVRPAGVWSRGDPSPVHLFTNGDMERSYSLGYQDSGLGRIGVNFVGEVALQEIVLWESDHTAEGGSVLDGELLVFGGAADLLDGGYLTPRADASGAVPGTRSTPFATEEGAVGQRGNPLPYASQGIDSPRTFNYKLIEQMDAREWYKGKMSNEADRFTDEPTTLALNERGQERYREGYVSQVDAIGAVSATADRRLTTDYGFRDAGAAAVRPEHDRESPDDPQRLVKPFLPGMLITTRLGHSVDPESPYAPDKIAGVDALGMLMGSIAMTGTGENGIASKVYDAFNRKTGEALDRYYRMSEPAAGLDSAGKPVFYADEDSPGYLEGAYRWTAGDLERSTVLVPDLHYLQEGDLLVRYQREGEPHVGIVVGFLGDKPAVGADGQAFLSKVQVVSVRRGFRTVTAGTWGNGGNTFGGFTVEPEMYQVRRLVRLRDGLTEPGPMRGADRWEVVTKPSLRSYTHYAPWQNVPWGPAISRVSPAVEQSRERLEHIKDYVYHREMPPTSFPTNVAQRSIFGAKKMVATNYTGWRNVKLAAGWQLSYHRGLDVVPEGGGNDIFAPEGGIFWVFVQRPAQQDAIDLSAVDKLTIETYLYEHYGAITVLVTNPENPREGRVYLFAHQNRATFEAQFAAHWPDGQNVPVSQANARTVGAGGWIGYMGSQGIGSAEHVHMEVYEYFPEYDEESIPTTEHGDRADPNYRWQRVDPRTVFKQELFRLGLSAPDYAKQILSYSVSRGAGGLFPDVRTAKQNFQPWWQPKTTGDEEVWYQSIYGGRP